MLLTARMASATAEGRGVAAASLAPCTEPGSAIVSGGEAADRELLVGRVLGRGVLDERLDHVVIRGVPVRRDAPVLAVPGLDAAGAGALVVGAAHLDRLENAIEAELLDACRGDVEVLEAPAHLLAGQRLVAVVRLGGADRLDAEHAVDQAAHVEDLAGLLPFGD